MNGQLLRILCLKLKYMMLNMLLRVMLIIDGLNEKLKERSVSLVVNILYVNDHGRNTQKCMVGKNL
jgi:hypothetical protein